MSIGIKLLIIFGSTAIAALVTFIIGSIMERRIYNNGICSECGRELKMFDIDHGGGRGYECPNCYKKVWVSYNHVDNINKKWR